MTEILHKVRSVGLELHLLLPLSNKSVVTFEVYTQKDVDFEERHEGITLVTEERRTRRQDGDIGTERGR